MILNWIIGVRWDSGFWDGGKRGRGNGREVKNC
jgi:hypothetical protein